MADLSNKKKAIYIICAVIIGMFIAAAILTVCVDTDDTEGEDSQYVTERRDKVINEEKKASQGGGYASTTTDDEMDPMTELNQLVGLESVKAEVASLVNLINVQKAREEQGLKNTPISYHLVFTGNPGTGKTTVARILSKIYRDLGVIKKGHMVETDRSGLIGQYIGQTAPKVNHMCDSALGGVLFIDEAYALTENLAGGADYGDEAVATLLKRMEDNRDNLIVIVAGYTNEMHNFVEANPGLKSRFTRYIHFPDYSSSELYDIYMMRIKKYNYTLNPAAQAALRATFDEVVALKDRNFGNGRYARNLFENTVTAQSDRLGAMDVSKMDKSELSVITPQDILKAKSMTKI